MLLTMGLIIGLVSTFTEVKLVHGIPAIRKAYTQGALGIDGIVWNTAGSFILSFIIGSLFGANGLVVMFGGVLGAAFSQAFFSIEGFCHARGWSWAGFKAGAHRYASNIGRAKSTVAKTIEDFRQPIADLKRLVIFTLKVITLPFILARKASVAYSARRQTA